MKVKDHAKILKRRVIWFEKVAREDEESKLVKEKIDEYFGEEEHELAYTMVTDMITLSHQRKENKFYNMYV